MADSYTLKEFDALVKGPGLFGLHLTRIRATLERLEALASERDEARAEAETLRAAIDGEPWGAAVLKQQRDEAIKRLGDTLEQLWAVEKARDEARAEAKYLREHMQNAGGEAWADAEGHEIRSYLRSILRGPGKEN